MSAGAPEPFLPAVPLPSAVPPDRADAPPRLSLITAEAPQRRLGVLLVVAALAYVADVVAKIVVVATMTEGEASQSLAGGLVTLRLIRNPGAAFGVGVGVTIVFTAISAVVVVAILRTSRRLGSLPWAVTLGLLLGGALGNLTDRIVRDPSPLRGHVIDFIELPGWPIFNLADSFICVAGAMMIFLAFRNVPLEGHARRG